MDIDSLALHGYAGRPSTSDVTQPLHLSTTFERDKDGTYPEGYSYTRRENPNRTSLEQAITALEGGKHGLGFASGSAATAAIFQALSAGDHVVVSQDTYHGTPAILRSVMARWGLKFDFVDTTRPDDVRAAMRKETRLVWVETPSNPMMRVSDLSLLAEIAHKGGALIVADNTVATPVLQNPLKLGCDFVLHSTTKYVSGHSDVLGGAVVAREDSELLTRIREIQHFCGAVPSPFDCWLTLRGIKTMPQRVRAQCTNALEVARFLKSQPRVEAVHYAGLEEHPGHALAAKQMRAFGGLMSFQVRGGEAQAFDVAARLEMIRRATSLGGVETLIEHRASMEGPNSTTPRNLLRLSVGLESLADLVQDLKQALA